MMTETARVVRRDGRQVELALERDNACGHCELSQGCGTGAIGRLLGRRQTTITIETDVPCQPGDRVTLALPDSALVRTSLLLYGLPLAGLLVTGGGLQVAAAPEWVVVTGALIGLYAGFRLAALGARRLEQSGLAPYIRGIEVNPEVPTGS